jgi:hypothetical protein
MRKLDVELVRLAKPGDRREPHHQPLSREKEACFALNLVVPFFCLLSSFAVATDLKVRVVDPRSAAVAGAQVTLLDRSGSAALDVQNTSADGTAFLRSSVTTPLRVRVLAPGFASHEVDVNPGGELLTVQLRLATQVETVVISSTLSPLPEEESGSNVSTLNHAQLTVMNPVAANDALRFLPGAVMNVQGQRGALSSLFVRGGDSRYNKVIVDGVRSAIQVELSTSGLCRSRKSGGWNSCGAHKARSTVPMP